MSQKLLPCPFCGSDAEFERVGTPRQSTIVSCTSCAAMLESNEEWDHGRFWNTRMSQTSDHAPQVPYPAEWAAAPLRYAIPHGKTIDEMRDNVRKSDLYKIGDTILVWVNEGDFWMKSPVLTETLSGEAHAAPPVRSAASTVEPAAWQPLPYETPRQLWAAFKAGAKFKLNYHGKVYDVTNMEAREHVVYVQPPGLPVKIKPNGSSGEGTAQTIWLYAAPTTSPEPIDWVPDAKKPVASPEPDAVRVKIVKLVEEIMLDEWNDICSDTECHPLDIKQLGRRKLEFSPNHWTRSVGGALAASLAALSRPAHGGVENGPRVDRTGMDSLPVPRNERGVASK